MQYKTHLDRLQDQYPDVDIEDVSKRASGFLRNSLNNGAWFRDRQSVVTGEGGHDSMILNAVTEVCAANGDTLSGLKNYASFLSSTYGERNENDHASLDEVVELDTDTDIAQPETREDSLLNAESPSDAAFERLFESSTSDATKWITDKERDFLDTYAHIGSVKEAAELSGVDYKRARMVLANLRRWVKRHSA